MNDTPKVTIGIPVYNGEKEIRRCIESVLTQTFTDFKLIISDNASTDNTENICREYALLDNRITYIRQAVNLGAEGNFRYILELAASQYFMWAAVDDIRSADFLMLQVSFLDKHPDFVSSTSPTTFFDKDVPDGMMGDWCLDHDAVVTRMLTYFSCWHANSHYYGLHRREAVVSWPEIYGDRFHGIDWTFIIHLMSLGKINRCQDGWVKLGTFGISNKKNMFAFYRKGMIDYFFPFHRTAMRALKNKGEASFYDTLSLMKKLIAFNMKGFMAQVEHDRWDKHVEHAIAELKIVTNGANPIVICGAGVIGSRLFGSLYDRGLNVALFTDRNAIPDGINIGGYNIPIVNIETALTQGFTTFIIASKKFSNEILIEIEEKSGENKNKLNIVKLYP